MTKNNTPAGTTEKITPSGYSVHYVASAGWGIGTRPIAMSRKRRQAAVAVPAALGHVCPWQDCIAVTSPIGQCDTGSTQHSCSHREGILVARRYCSLLRSAGTADPGSGLVKPEQQLFLATRGIHCNASHGLFLSRAELPAKWGIASHAMGSMDTARSAQQGRD